MDNYNITYSNELEKRDQQYTVLLQQYAVNQKRMHLARLIFKYIFFGIICLSFVFIVRAGLNILLLVAQKENTTFSDLGVALTGLGSILGSAIIVL